MVFTGLFRALGLTTPNPTSINSTTTLPLIPKPPRMSLEEALRGVQPSNPSTPAVSSEPDRYDGRPGSAENTPNNFTDSAAALYSYPDEYLTRPEGGLFGSVNSQETVNPWNDWNIFNVIRANGEDCRTPDQYLQLKPLKITPEAFSGNGDGTWFSNQSDRSIYTTIVTAGKEARITTDHKDQLAVAAVIENRGESPRWNPGGKLDGEAISRQPNQFVAINGLGSINNENDAVKALAKKFGSTDAARQYVQYMYQTLKNGSIEYSEVQDWLRGRDSFRSANSHNYNGTPLIASGNRYGW
jgi:hypothetical protein